MAQQTAVDWFYEEIVGMLDCNEVNDFPFIKWKIKNSLLLKAKEMEKEQSMNDFMAGKWDWAEHIKGKESKDPAEYYNETYK